jgi:branched-subunit amino acid ABC-type transport system permease component
MDVEIIINAFIVVVIGGLGSFWGTFLGALIVGPVYALGILVFPRLSMIFIYVIMVVVLMTRPWGLLGRPLQR